MTSRNDDRCAVCGGPMGSPMQYPAKRNDLGFELIVNCAICGFGSASPSVDQARLDHFYANGGYWDGATNTRDVQAHQRVQAKVRRDFVDGRRSLHGEVSILDIGAGHAFLADAFDELPGTKVRYAFIEPDEKVATLNLAKDLRRVSLSRVESIDLEGSYDVVFLNQVLEHVADPVAFLRALIKRLKPTGVLYVEVPHRDDRLKNDVFPHTCFFSRSSLERCGINAGYSVVAIEAFGGTKFLRGSLSTRIYGRLFHHALQLRLSKLGEFLNRRMVDYRPVADGIWLRGTFSVR